MLKFQLGCFVATKIPAKSSEYYVAQNTFSLTINSKRLLIRAMFLISFTFFLCQYISFVIHPQMGDMFYSWVAYPITKYIVTQVK